MTDLRQELLDVFVGRATRRYGLSGEQLVTQVDGDARVEAAR